MSLSEDIAIRVDNLSKEFKLYARPADMFIELIKGKPRYKSFWALKDISFNVHRGQVVGILGRNGAGKSTLLNSLFSTDFDVLNRQQRVGQTTKGIWFSV